MPTTHEAVHGLSANSVSALRYNSKVNHPCESTGILLGYLRNNERLLDIGCGTGSITALLRDARYLSVIGIEPHPERAEVARKEGLDVITGLYDENISQNLGSFDSILFADVLEHLVDPAQILEDVKKSLSPNGRVLASIPNVAHWSVRLKLLFGNFNYQPTGIMDATHLRWFTRDSVIRLFDAAGYDVDTICGSAGGWMRVYDFTPLRYLSASRKSYIIGRLCRIFPGLFSVQHVISARPRW